MILLYSTWQGIVYEFVTSPGGRMEENSQKQKNNLRLGQPKL